MRAKQLGMLVNEINKDLYVTAPILSAIAVRVSDDGLQDLIARMHSYVDRRDPSERARTSATHARICDLMKYHAPFCNEHSMLMYNPKQRIVKDLRIIERYMTAKRDAERAAMQYT
jgi:hypothetical protein